MKKMIRLLLAAVLLMSLSGCGGSGNAQEDTSEAVTTQAAEAVEEETKRIGISLGSLDGPDGDDVSLQEDEADQPEKEKLSISEEFRRAAAAFAWGLFQRSLQKETNTMVAPVSVQAALALAANGAERETLNQMLEILAGGMTLEDWNADMSAWMANLSGEELKLANSVWYRGDADWLTVRESYLEEMQKVYDAGVFVEDFTDPATEKKMNDWVAEKTDGMIDEIVDNLTERTDMALLLINAMAFDAEWKKPYLPAEMQDGIFMKENGDTEDVQMMCSNESWYLTDENAVGFVKDYKEGYRFVVLLPSEGVSVQEYVTGLTGERFLEVLENAEEAPVKTAIPKFSSEYEVNLSELLQDWGMCDAFDEGAADFTVMAECEDGRNLSIGQVLHKTKIEVDENGTKAGASTSVNIMATGLAPEINLVVCDRPFVYAVVDAESGLPVFVGTVMEVNG